MIASRGCRRRLRATAVGALLLGITACGTGQIAQTADAVPVVPGVNVDIGPNQQIGLRNVQIAYNGPGGYPKGGAAPLLVRIFNSGPTPVKLTGVSATGFAEKVVLVGAARATPLPTRSASPTAASPLASASASATARPSASRSANASASASPSASPTPAPTPTPGTPAGQEGFSITIDASSYVLLVPGQGGYLQLVGLTSALQPGQSVRIEFTFDNELRAQIDVPVGVPTTPLPRLTVTAEPA